MEKTKTDFAWVVKTNDAEEINRLHQLGIDELQVGVNHVKAALEHFAQCGELLIKKKDELAHGEWLPWIRLNCNFKERTARYYIELAANWQRVADFDNIKTLRAAIILLSEPKPEKKDDISYWNNDEDIIASLDGIKAIKRTIVRLNNPEVDPEGAKLFRKMFKKTLDKISQSIIE